MFHLALELQFSIISDGRKKTRKSWMHVTGNVHRQEGISGEGGNQMLTLGDEHEKNKRRPAVNRHTDRLTHRGTRAQSSGHQGLLFILPGLFGCFPVHKKLSG